MSIIQAKVRVPVSLLEKELVVAEQQQRLSEKSENKDASPSSSLSRLRWKSAIAKIREENKKTRVLDWNSSDELAAVVRALAAERKKKVQRLVMVFLFCFETC